MQRPSRENVPDLMCEQEVVKSIEHPCCPLPFSKPLSIFTDRSKALLLLWFLSVTCCCVYVYMVSNGMFTCILAVHYASCLVLFCNFKIGNR